MSFLICEVVSVLTGFGPESSRRLTGSWKVIGFRNMLTHGYASVDHEAVYETALQDVSKLGRGCLELLRESEDVVKNGPEQRSGADKQFHSPEPPPIDSCYPSSTSAR